MTAKPLKQAILPAIRLTVLLLFGAVSAFADCPNKVRPPAGDPLHMLALGDSIMWGQGLKQDRKFWWRVKCWLEEKTERQVVEKVVAHSGAHLDNSQTTPPRFTSNDGEVNLPFPTVNQQLDQVLKFYGNDRLNVDLVLVNGCINDVDVSNLLDATTAHEWLRGRVTTACRTGMHALLRRIATSFPNAQVLVPG